MALMSKGSSCFKYVLEFVELMFWAILYECVKSYLCLDFRIKLMDKGKLLQSQAVYCIGIVSYLQ
jgi:hypothetical protein